jgi:hypothetical protein
MIQYRTYTDKELIRFVTSEDPFVQLLIQRLEQAEVSASEHTKLLDELDEVREELREAKDTISELEDELREYR